LTYVTYPDGVGISGCLDSSCPSEIVIPEMIDSKKVTRIEDGAFCQWYFNNNPNPDSIILPNTIKHIGEEAFCNLDSILIPSSVVSIVNGSFIDIEGDIYILKPAEQNLNIFDFPVEANLYACEELDEGGNPVNCEDAYPSITRNLLDYDTAQALVDSTGHVEIPNTYTMIEDAAFAFSSITSITIPDSILHIGEEAFVGNNLDSLIIPSSVISIIDGTFEEFEGDMYIIKPVDQYINPYYLPHTSNHFVCESVDGSGTPVGCEDLWQSTTSVNAQFTYNIIDNGIEITGCVATCPSELVIPDEIDGLTVTSIGYGAFEGRSLNSVTLPATLTNIDNDAFYYNNLTSINFPEELARIGSEAFSHNQFNTISIPSNISIIEEGAFAENPGENYENWNYIQIRNQILLLGCVDSCPSNLVIPESINGVQVAFIGKEAFSEDEIYTLSLPEGLIEIESEAFAENYLTEVIIPETVTSLATNAFKYNSGLQHEIFTYLKINNSALLIKCTEPCPTDLIIPETIDGYSVTFIDDSAFENSGISSLSLPNTLKHIEEWGFADNLLTSITIPYSITGLEGDTFYYNPLESIHFLGNRPEFDITNRDFQGSATLNLVTYCPNTIGWPGEPIEGITPQLDETCDSDNDGVINTDDAFPFDSSRNIDESSDNSNDQSEDQYAILDIDQNGSFDALTDGLILLRYAFGLTGDNLINGAIDTNANRTTAAEIEVYIQTLVP
jgi:transcription antitermination factor NusG